MKQMARQMMRQMITCSTGIQQVDHTSKSSRPMRGHHNSNDDDEANDQAED
jgi:hypothetical protein|tara:strand:+ start:308 stop:460 length:153 start_codon:yes stop_codon:yes gene_type:complete